jgi:hypothetical protein
MKVRDPRETVVVADISGDFWRSGGRMIDSPGGAGVAGAALGRVRKLVADLKPILLIWYPQIIHNTTCGSVVVQVGS